MEKAEGARFKPKAEGRRTELLLGVERRLHAALYVRDASGLDVGISEGVPPKGGMIAGSQVLPVNPNIKDAVTAWLAWWKSIIEWDYMFNPALPTEERTRKEAEIATCETNADLGPLISRFAQQAERYYDSWEFIQSAETGKQELRQICGRAFDQIPEASLKRASTKGTRRISVNVLVYDIPWSWSPKMGHVMCTTSLISGNPKALELIIAKAVLVALEAS